MRSTASTQEDPRLAPLRAFRKAADYRGAIGQRIGFDHRTLKICIDGRASSDAVDGGNLAKRKNLELWEFARRGVGRAAT
jgi:hypothetical protein